RSVRDKVSAISPASCPTRPLIAPASPAAPDDLLAEARCAAIACHRTELIDQFFFTSLCATIRSRHEEPLRRIQHLVLGPAREVPPDQVCGGNRSSRS